MNVKNFIVWVFYCITLLRFPLCLGEDAELLGTYRFKNFNQHISEKTHNGITSERDQATGAINVVWKPRCSLSLFKKDLLYSSEFENCYWLIESLLCEDERRRDQSYLESNGDLIYKNCYRFVNYNSRQWNTIKQLSIDLRSYDPLCDTTMSVTPCQCGVYIEGIKQQYEQQLGEIKKTVNNWEGDFELCATDRSKLFERNLSLTAELNKCFKNIDDTIKKNEKCEKQRKIEGEKMTEISSQKENTNEELIGCVSRSAACETNLTIINARIEWCENNVTDTHVKRNLENNKCELERNDLQQQIKDALLPEKFTSENIHVSIEFREYINVALLTQNTDELRSFFMNFEFRANAYTSKFGSSDNFSPAVPIALPRTFVKDLCAAHCREVKEIVGANKEIKVSKIELNENPEKYKRYRPPTGFSLHVTGTATFWIPQIQIELQSGYMSEIYKYNDGLHIVLSRKAQKNYELCMCVMKKGNFSDIVRRYGTSLSARERRIMDSSKVKGTGNVDSVSKSYWNFPFMEQNAQQSQSFQPYGNRQYGDMLSDTRNYQQNLYQRSYQQNYQQSPHSSYYSSHPRQNMMSDQSFTHSRRSNFGHSYYRY